jgi:hypothetical protein
MTYRAWTISELKRAAEMWERDLSAEEIAEALGRGVQSVKHQIRRHRDRFPRKRQPHGTLGSVGGSLKVQVTEYMLKLIKKRAKEQGTSMAVVIREILRKELIYEGQREKLRRSRAEEQPRVRHQRTAKQRRTHRRD